MWSNIIIVALSIMIVVFSIFTKNVVIFFLQIKCYNQFKQVAHFVVLTGIKTKTTDQI